MAAVIYTCYSAVVVAILTSVTGWTPSGELKEYCFPNSFNASCGPSDVILMTSARYGRMREGKCLSTPLHVGCWADVLSHVDRQCSGRHECIIEIPDLTLQNLQPCPKDMFAYLEASYTCLPVVLDPSWSCHHHLSITVPATSGYLSSIATMETGLGSRNCPWRISVSPGQRINVSLIDFGVASRLTQSGSVCQVYAKIREKGVASEITICGGRSRERSVYVSETNEIDVMMLTARDDVNPIYFLLKYDVVGCTDPVVPRGAWLKRTGDKAVIGCNYTTQAWHIVCNGNEWFGKLENCTAASANPQSDGLASYKGDFPYGLMVAVITGLVLGVLIGVALLAMVIVCHKKKRRRGRSTKERSPPEEALDNVQGTPFLHETKITNPSESLDSGYGYTHVCDVTIYQPYQQRQIASYLKDCNVAPTGGGLCGQEHYERPSGRKSSFATPPRNIRLPPDFIADHRTPATAHSNPEEKTLSGSTDH